jgi:hypothetical protein
MWDADDCKGSLDLTCWRGVESRQLAHHSRRHVDDFLCWRQPAGRIPVAHQQSVCLHIAAAGRYLSQRRDARQQQPTCFQPVPAACAQLHTVLDCKSQRSRCCHRFCIHASLYKFVTSGPPYVLEVLVMLAPAAGGNAPGTSAQTDVLRALRRRALVCSPNTCRQQVEWPRSHAVN